MRFGFAGAGLLVFLATVAAVFTGGDATLSAQAQEKGEKQESGSHEKEKSDGGGDHGQKEDKGGSEEKGGRNGEKHAEASESEESEASGEGVDHKGKERAPASSKTESFDESSFGNAASGRFPEQSQVEDLRKQRELLESKQKELATREAELAARERALDEELKKLKDAREELVKLDGARKAELEEKVAKVVETIETMSPKAASAMVATLDEGLAVAAMSRIATPKLAKIMNLMEPAKSSRLTELLAGVTAGGKNRGTASSQPAKGRSTASNGAATVTTAEAPSAPASTKGGKNLNGNQEQSNANAGGPAAAGAPAKN